MLSVLYECVYACCGCLVKENESFNLFNCLAWRRRKSMCFSKANEQNFYELFLLFLISPLRIRGEVYILVWVSRLWRQWRWENEGYRGTRKKKCTKNVGKPNNSFLPPNTQDDNSHITKLSTLLRVFRKKNIERDFVALIT